MAELRRNNLTFIEAVGQSVCSLSPTFTPALGVAVVGGMAGANSWLVYLLATISVTIVGINIGKLAKRIPAAGLFLYVSRTLGPSWGLLSGWAMLVAYLFTAVALTVATSIFFKDFFGAIGFSSMPPNFVIYAAVSALIWILAYRDVKLSTRFGLTLEALSVVAIIVVCFLIWKSFGFKMDLPQVHLQGRLRRNDRAGNRVRNLFLGWVRKRGDALEGNSQPRDRCPASHRGDGHRGWHFLRCHDIHRRDGLPRRCVEDRCQCRAILRCRRSVSSRERRDDVHLFRRDD